MKENMKEINNRKTITAVLILTLTIFVTSCNKTFKVEKVESGFYMVRGEKKYFEETYFFSNLPYRYKSPSKYDSALHSVIKQRIIKLIQTDSIDTNEFVFSFIRDTHCARRYYESYKPRYALFEICEGEDEDIYIYKKSDENYDLWISDDFGNSNDTIFVK